MAVRSTPKNPASPPAGATRTPAARGTDDAPTLIPQGAYAGKPGMPMHRPLILVGSRQRAHVHLVSNSVSRVHAALINTDHGTYVRDLSSRTGTIVNGRRVNEADLSHSDTLQIGPFQFKYSDRTGRGPLSATPRAPRAALIVQGRQAPVPIGGRTLLIGQRDTSDLPLPSTAVSTAHALVFELNGRHYIRDLGSRTGTFVNGQQIHQEALQVGDTIRVGETTMRYHAAAPARAPKLEEAPAPVTGRHDEPATIPLGAAAAGAGDAVQTQGADLEPDTIPAEPEPQPAAEELDLTVGARDPIDLEPPVTDTTAMGAGVDVAASAHAGVDEEPIPLESEPPDLVPEMPAHSVTTPGDVLGLENEADAAEAPAASIESADTGFDQLPLEAVPSPEDRPDEPVQAAPPTAPEEPKLPLDDPEPALTELEALLPPGGAAADGGGIETEQATPFDLAPGEEPPLDVTTLEPLGPLTDTGLDLDGSDRPPAEDAEQPSATATRSQEAEQAESEAPAPPDESPAAAPFDEAVSATAADLLPEEQVEPPATPDVSAEQPPAQEITATVPVDVEVPRATPAELAEVPLAEATPETGAAAPAEEMEPPAAKKKGRAKRGTKKAESAKKAAAPKKRGWWGKKPQEAPAVAPGEEAVVLPVATPEQEPSQEGEAAPELQLAPEPVADDSPEVAPEPAADLTAEAPGVGAEDTPAEAAPVSEAGPAWVAPPAEDAALEDVTVETVASTEPSPESALDLGLPETDAGFEGPGAANIPSETADVEPLELEPIDAQTGDIRPPSDASFDRVLEEFSGPSTGPIVEQPANADVSSVGAEEPVRLPDAPAEELHLPEEPVGQPAAAADVTPLDELPLPPPQADELAGAGGVGVTTHEAFVPPEPPPLDFPEEPPAATGVTAAPPELELPPQPPPLEEAPPEVAPAAAGMGAAAPPEPAAPAPPEEPAPSFTPASAPEAPPPKPGPPRFDPFFGMGRDEGSFIGGMPVLLPPLGRAGPPVGPPAMPPAPPREPPVRHGSAAGAGARGYEAPLASPAAPPTSPPASSDATRLPDLQEPDKGAGQGAAGEDLFDDASLSLSDPAALPSTQPAPSSLAMPPAMPLAMPPALPRPLPREAKSSPQAPPQSPPPRAAGRPQYDDIDQVDPLAFGEAEAETLQLLPKPSGTAPGGGAAAPAPPRSQPPPPPAPAAKAPPPDRGAPKPASKYPATPPPPARGGRARQPGQRGVFDRGPLDAGLTGLGLGAAIGPPDVKGPPPPGGAHAFDGLALPPVREADVFAPLPFGGLDDPFAGRAAPAARPQGTDLGDAAAPTFDLPPTDPTAGSAVGLVGLASAGAAAVPAGRRGGAGAPFDAPHLAAPERADLASLEAAPAPAPGFPPGAPPPRRSRLGVGLLLLGMILSLAAAGAGIWFLGPRPGVEVIGTLQFDRLREISELDRKQFEQRQRDLLRKPEFRAHAREVLKIEDVQRPYGFLGEDPKSTLEYEAMVEQARVRDRSNTFAIAYRGRDEQGDRARMRAIIKALYARNKPEGDAAARARRDYDEAQRKLKDLAAQIDQLKQQATALRSRGDALPALQDKLKKLQAQDDKLRAAAIAARGEVDRLRAQLDRAQLGPGAMLPEPLLPDAATVALVEARGADPQTRRRQDRLDAVASGADVVPSGAAGAVEQAGKALEAALAAFDARLADASAALRGDAEGAQSLRRYVEAGRTMQQALRDASDDLARRHQADRDYLNDMKRRLAERGGALLRDAWAADGKLRQLEQTLAVKTRHRNAALDNGLRKDAGRLEGEMAGLSRAVEARRAEVAAARAFEAEEKELRAFVDRTLARMDEDRARDGERMEALLAAFAAEAPAVEKLPQAQRELAASLRERSRELTEARQRYAAALASADGSSDAEAVALRQKQGADPRSRVDARRNELALAAAVQEAAGPEGAAEPQGDDAGEAAEERERAVEVAPADGATTEEGAPDEAEPAAGREAEVARLRKALAAAIAREKQATAAADQSAREVSRLKEEVTLARDADVRLNPLLESRIAAEKAHEQQLAAAEKLRKELSMKIAPQEPGDDAVTATRAGEDRRLYYILFAGAAIVVGFSILMWLTAYGSHVPPPATPYEAPPVS